MGISNTYDFELDGKVYRLQVDRISYKKAGSRSVVPFSCKPKYFLFEQKTLKDTKEKYWQPVDTEVTKNTIPLKQIYRCWVP